MLKAYRIDKQLMRMGTGALLLLASLSLLPLSTLAQGLPFLRNFTPATYHAHNHNFDIEIGENGTIYVANFEGVLYYDRAEWRIIHTPGITRVTVIYGDKKGMIWTGGYNYFGRVETSANGELYLKRVGKKGLFRGEVVEIWEKDGKMFFLVSDSSNDYVYQVDGDKVTLSKQINNQGKSVGLSDVIDTDKLNSEGAVVVLTDVTQTEPLDNGLQAVVKRSAGLSIIDQSGRELYTITEANGLCSNNVTYVAYDGHGMLWGATEKGIFTMAVPSAFSRFTASEGLSGDVLSIERFDGRMYAGTTDGLFRQEGRRFVRLPGINHACWKLSVTGQGMLAATANGIYRISAGGAVSQLTSESATTLLPVGSQIYSGEMDGVYLHQSLGKGQEVCGLEKVTKILQDGQGTIWLQNLFGDVWSKQAADTEFKPYQVSESGEMMATIVPIGSSVEVVSNEATVPFSYPQFSYLDDAGVTWLTDENGKSLYRWKDGKRLDDMDKMLCPFGDLMVRSLYSHDSKIWIGADDGLVVIDTSQQDPALLTKPQLRFRSVWLGSDSLLWGGYGDMPKKLPSLASNERHLRFTYALDHKPLVGKTLYRYKLNNGNWCAWEDDKDAEFVNLDYGSYTITVQARLATGELTEPVEMNFNIAAPFYMRWYMMVLYVILAMVLVYALFRYRLHRLNVDRQRLERIVQERTAEVVKQKDEIEEKSKSLETALHDLGEAQHELIRQEKMATVGKLTQGLIDRILNPLNYINNFSKLSVGLVNDVIANIEDEKDKMDEENFEDTMDVLGMLRGNLQKVGDHGQNTTRIMKAMEEMLKDRTSGIKPMNLVPVLRQDEEMLNNYYEKDISTYGIHVVFDVPQEEVNINGNAEQLTMMLMSLLGNAHYALVKKAQREKYQPELSLKLSSEGGKYIIKIRDNGIGIEDTIIDKVFDPFFTTKTTGEAAGVGLYLSREIVQNHGGDITIQSVKNEYCEVTLTLPALKR